MEGMVMVKMVDWLLADAQGYDVPITVEVEVERVAPSFYGQPSYVSARIMGATDAQGGRVELDYRVEEKILDYLAEGD